MKSVWILGDYNFDDTYVFSTKEKAEAYLDKRIECLVNDNPGTEGYEWRQDFYIDEVDLDAEWK